VQAADDCVHVTVMKCHRITESLRLEKTSRSPSPTVTPTPPCLLNHVPKRHIYTFFEPLQGRRLHHCPGQPVSVFHNSFSKEIFPNIQPKPPLTQLLTDASLLATYTRSFRCVTSKSCESQCSPNPIYLHGGVQHNTGWQATADGNSFHPPLTPKALLN